MCKAQLNVLNVFDFYTVEFFKFIFLNFLVVFYQLKISIRNMMLKPESRDLTFFHFQMNPTVLVVFPCVTEVQQPITWLMETSLGTADISKTNSPEHKNSSH